MRKAKNALSFTRLAGLAGFTVLSLNALNAAAQAAPVAPAPAPTVPEVAAAPVAPETTAPTTQDAAPVAEEPVAQPKPQRAKVVAPAKKKEPGFLRINAYGWAYVKIDNGSRGQANTKYTLSPGRHVVKMWNDVGAAQTKIVTIESGRVKTIKVNLSEDLVEEQN